MCAQFLLISVYFCIAIHIIIFIKVCGFLVLTALESYIQSTAKKLKGKLSSALIEV